MLILMAGLPGTGKTTLARQLAARLQAVVLSKDTVRHALFPPELVEYSTGQDDFVIDLLLRTAEYIWRRRPRQIIILDGRTFSNASQRQQVIEFAQRLGQEWRTVECVCADEIARNRLTAAATTHPAQNRTPALYEEMKRRWEPMAQPKVTVKTDGEVDFESLILALR